MLQAGRLSFAVGRGQPHLRLLPRLYPHLVPRRTPQNVPILEVGTLNNLILACDITPCPYKALKQT